VAVEGVIDTQFHRAEEPMQVKINAYLSQRRRAELRPFSQVTSASVPSRDSCEVLDYFQYEHWCRKLAVVMDRQSYPNAAMRFARERGGGKL
jgi:hypothetical protein